MTLENFFTTGKMDCGLSTPPRVEELVAVMQKEKDGIVKDGDDATRQWSSLAHVIAATENKDCLSLFAKLDGLRYLGWWLKGALTIGDCDHLVFESITKVLQAFEKFEIDEEKLLSTGIWDAVKSLLSHKSSVVQQRARTLFDSWNLTKDADVVETGVEEATIACEGALEVRDEPNEAIIELSNVHSPQSMLDKESDLLHSPGHDVRAEPAAELLESTQIPDRQISSQFTSNDGNDGHISSDASCSTVKVDSVKTISKGTLEDRSSEDGELGNGEGMPDGMEPHFSADSNEQIDETDYAGDRLDKVGPSEPDDFPMAGTSDTPELVVKPFEGTKGEYNGVSSIGGLAISTPNFSSGMVDVQNGASTSECNSHGKHEVCLVNSSHDSHGDGSERTLVKMDDVETSSPIRADIETINNVREHKKVGHGHSTRASRYTRPARGSTSITNKVLDMDLEYCTVDALEIACLVANEVVREVGDYDERSGSSSSERTEQDDLSEDDKVRTVESFSAETSAKAENPVLSRSGLGTGHEYCVQDLNASEAIETAQRAEIDSFKGTSTGIDLNLVFSDDDQMLSSDYYQAGVFTDNQSVEACLNNDQVSVNPVAGSLAAACVLPGVSDGRHEWKESASTSDAEGAPFMVEAGRRPMKMTYPHIDLNADDFADDVAELTEHQVRRSPATCDLGSSVELNFPRTGMPVFDLNKNSEVVNDAPHWRLNGMQEFNFNLNDDPANFEDSLYGGQNYLGDTSTHKASTDGALSDDSDIIFMGTRINMTQPSASPISRPFWSSGHQASSATDFYYTPSTIYGHNSHVFPPSGTISPGINGLSSMIPRVDPIGFPKAPHIISPVEIAPVSYPQPTFFRNMAGFLPGPAGDVPRDPGLEMNSGFFSNGVAQDSGAPQQFIAPVMGRPLERTFLSLGKRNEPDGGFATYPDPYRLDLHL